MNLQKLFTAQAELDAYIEQQHPTLPGENRLEKKVLALLVELGECANEWRGFKFWSNNQEANLLRYNYAKGEDYDALWCPTCGDYMGVDHGLSLECDTDNMIALEESTPLLEEYVDCLHFILSIGNEVYGTLTSKRSRVIVEEAKIMDENPDVGITFIVLYSYVTDLIQKEFNYRDYEKLIIIFLNLGLLLGFTFEQIESAYWAKYEINKQRQVDGY